MNCDGVVRSISGYIDNELEPTVKHEFEVHTADCWECKVLVEQTRNTVRIFFDCDLVDLPADARKRLHEKLRKNIGHRPSR